MTSRWTSAFRGRRKRLHVAKRIGAGAWLLASLGCAGVLADDAPPAPPAKVVEFVVGVGAVEAQPAVPEETFDQWVFQQDRSAAEARRKLDAVLALHVADVDRVCQLTDDQKHKLELAGRGDLKRFFDRCEKVRQRFLILRHDQQKLQEIWQDISPLQSSLRAGLFGPGSLFRKALSKSMTSEQLAAYAVLLNERRTYRHRAGVELVVGMFEEVAPLQDGQRTAFVDLLLKETKPPRQPSQYDFYVMIDQIGRIPEGKIKPLVAEQQWKLLERVIAQYKGVVPSLRQSGQLPRDDDDPEAAPPVRKVED